MTETNLELAAVTIVSVFGRGNWLAVEAAKHGIPTCLLDVTKQMGVWAPQDWEGPFGVLMNDKTEASLKLRYVNDDPLQEVATGVNLWFQDGPLEMKSSVSGYRLSQMPPSFHADQVLKSISANSKWDWDDLEKSKSKPTSSWEPQSGTLYRKAVTRRGLATNLDWVEQAGVRVLRNAQIKDLAVSGPEIKALEVEKDRSELLRTEKVIWTLSSSESAFLSPSIKTQLLKNRVLENEWVWVRYRFRIEASYLRDQLPQIFFVINDFKLPLCYTNLITVIKTDSEELYDVWIRIPEAHRFQKQYLSEKAEELTNALSAKMRDVGVKVQDMPQEYHYGYEQLGPSCWPVFNAKSLSSFAKPKFKNLIWSSLEEQLYLGSEAMNELHRQTKKQLFDWWKIREQNRIKKESAKK